MFDHEKQDEEIFKLKRQLARIRSRIIGDHSGPSWGHEYDDDLVSILDGGPLSFDEWLRMSPCKVSEVIMGPDPVKDGNGRFVHTEFSAQIDGHKKAVVIIVEVDDV